MPKDPTIEQFQEERRAILGSTLAGTPSDSWPRVRQHLVASPSIYTDRHINTVWEGPSRSLLLPLPFEVLRDFTRRFGSEAVPILIAALSDPEPLVVGYALHALSKIDSDHFAAHARSVADRQEALQTICGSLGWEGSIAEYGIRLHTDS
jgi:hypothetical protein